VTELGYLLSRSVGFVPGDEYQLVILGSVGDAMCCGYGDGSAALNATVNDSGVLITSSNGVPVMSSTKSMRNVSCIVRYFSIADSAPAATPVLKMMCRSTTLESCFVATRFDKETYRFIIKCSLLLINLACLSSL
jgi:hypothetical protein